MERKNITEESGEHKAWKVEAEKISTPEELATFVTHLTDDYIHDYGTIVHAMAAAMLAAYRVVNESDQGGITGFQASCLGWEMIRKFFGETEAPRRLVNMGNLLYPQYAEEFTSIDSETADWLKKEAKKRLDENVHADPAVVSHWRAVANGAIPFGLNVRNE